MSQQGLATGRTSPQRPLLAPSDGPTANPPSGPRTRRDAHFPDPRDEPGPGLGRTLSSTHSPVPTEQGTRALRRYEPLRFSDVIDELRSIARMAAGDQDSARADGATVAAACGRVESLIHRLQSQFMRDVVFGDGPSVPATTHAAGPATHPA